jgi:hypothetical protein
LWHRCGTTEDNTLCHRLERARLQPGQKRDNAISPLEYFSNTRAVFGYVQGGFFLREKTLGILLSLYSNWKNAFGAGDVSGLLSAGAEARVFSQLFGTDESVPFSKHRKAEKQPQIPRLTTPKLKNAWGPVRSG